MKKKKRSKRPARAFLSLALLLVLLLCVFVAGSLFDRSRQQPQQRGSMSEDFAQRPRVQYNGEEYVRRMEQTPVLLMGVDRSADVQSEGFRQGGQADFLMLVLIDHENAQVRRLQIDRDTMTQVVTLGVLGNRVGTRELQICLSHGFGADDAERCQYTVEAVENLLQGAKIDLYAALDLESIGLLNDALGGVEVTVSEDLTAHDPALTKGSTVRLSADQAEIFVRYRYAIGGGTNEERMLRQRVYMQSAWDSLRAQAGKDVSFVERLYDSLGEALETNIARGRLVNEMDRAINYDILPVETLAGEYTIGPDGFMEFHADADSALAWVMEAMYETVSR